MYGIGRLGSPQFKKKRLGSPQLFSLTVTNYIELTCSKVRLLYFTTIGSKKLVELGEPFWLTKDSKGESRKDS
jgi:hypothetical protein